MLYNHSVRSALASRHAGWFHLPLDIDAMRRGIAHLAGKHDFTSFRSSQCQAASPVRTIEEVMVSSRGPYVIFDITADAFLHHMVRNIVGTLIYVGKRRYPAEWVAELLRKRDRSKAAPTISPAGLYLKGVRYAPEWRLPEFARMIDPLTGNSA